MKASTIRDIDLHRGLVHVAFNYVVRAGRRVRKDTKTHQDRWLADNVERQARDGTLAGLAAGTAQLLEAVTRSLPEPWQNRPAARDAIRKIMALYEHLATYLFGQETTLAELLFRLRGWAMWCLNDLGDSFTLAIDYGTSLVADFERVLGGTHSNTLASRNNLASVYRSAGRRAEAENLQKRTSAAPGTAPSSGRWPSGWSAGSSTGTPPTRASSSR